MKKLALLLAVVMVVCSFGAVTVFAAGGSGVEGDPYLISTAEEFAAISADNDAYYKLTENIDLADVTWTPFVFKGHLDGNNKEITNFTLDVTGGTVGMFTYMQGATVENLIIKSGSVKTTSNSVGALVGEAQSGSVVRNVTNYASVTGNQIPGGIVGIGNNVLVENCVNYGTITATSTGDSFLGGILGYNYDLTTIRGCTNEGALTGVSYVGGIIGRDRQNLIVEDCTNNGNLTVTKNSNGGIATTIAETSSIDNCINNGDIATGTNDNAGIVAATSGSVTNCKNYGDVTQNSWTAGGITAGFSKGVLNNCENYGNITSGQNNTGGIVGQAGSNLEITDCNNYGTVTGGYQYTGGIVGNMSNGSIADCYNEGTLAGNRNHGGIIGNAYAMEIIRCTNAGAIGGTGSSIGGIVGVANGNADALTTVTDCINTGAVASAETKNEYVGGIVANANYTTITNCTNNGVVSSNNQRIGGIAGGLGTASTVTDCTNTQSVSGTNYVGGIAGQVSASETVVTKVVNSGTVSGANQVGGIVGSSSAALTQLCANLGVVSSTGGNRGGIFGQFIGTGVITDCYNISDSESIGGFVGAIETVGATITNCYTMGSGANAMYNWKKGTLADSSNVFYCGTYSKANEAVAKTEEEFADGTVVALLNGDRTGAAAVWTQGESYPVFKTASEEPEVPAVTAAEITGSDATSVSFAVTLADADATAKIIVAIYSGDYLMAVKTVSAADTSATFETTTGATLAKIFVWESLTTIKPIVMDEYEF